MRNFRTEYVCFERYWKGWEDFGERHYYAEDLEDWTWAARRFFSGIKDPVDYIRRLPPFWEEAPRCSMP